MGVMSISMNKLTLIFIGLIAITTNAQGHERVYSGTYSWGPEVHAFKPCNSEEHFWVSFDWAGIEMQEYYKNNTKKPYQVMYLEFRGIELDEVVDGFAATYSGLVRISEVKKYTFEVPALCK